MIDHQYDCMKPNQINYISPSRPDIIQGAHRFSRQAMATVFEIMIVYPDVEYAGQAAYAAFEELDRIENELSRFISNSDVSRINNLTPQQSTTVGLETFECLQQCSILYRDTSGAFDITIGTLLQCWINPDKSPRQPTPSEIQAALKCTGMHLVILNQSTHTVQLKKAPMMIDLGGYGKGYAVDCMAALLREWSIDTALIHSGGSTVLALEAPPELAGWPVTISHPQSGETIKRIDLTNRAVSGSGLKKGHHIIDPRTGSPIKKRSAAWSLANTAAQADALSTALMIMTPDETRRYLKSQKDAQAIVIEEKLSDNEQTRVMYYGFDKQ